MSLYPTRDRIKKVKHALSIFVSFLFVARVPLSYPSTVGPSHLSSQGVRSIFGGSEAIPDDIIAKIRFPLLTYQGIAVYSKIVCNFCSLLFSSYSLPFLPCCKGLRPDVMGKFGDEERLLQGAFLERIHISSTSQSFYSRPIHPPPLTRAL